jgi:hypothetical protein
MLTTTIKPCDYGYIERHNIMTQYKLTLNGKELTSGTKLDCFKFLLSIEAFESFEELHRLGYKIEGVQ